MLFAEPTKYHAGIRIFGDFLDFYDLRETIHYLVEGYPIGGSESPLGEFVLELACEVRHAYQKDRETRQTASYLNEPATYVGFTSLWPYLLPQVGLLRRSASFHSTSRHHQAILLKLEACIEEVLYSINPAIGKEVFDWLIHFSDFTDNYYIHFIEHCALSYVAEGRAGKARFHRLPKILFRMASWGDEYRIFASRLEAAAEENGCSPHDLAEELEWPEFKL